MTKEDRELLFIDLCARLPYGVKCQVKKDEYTYIGTLCRIEVVNENFILVDFAESMSGCDCQVNLSEIKPYLLPLSSMTEEQKKELGEMSWILQSFGIINRRANIITHFDCIFLINWLIRNNFDYMGLILKGLAIDATGKKGNLSKKLKIF